MGRDYLFLQRSSARLVPEIYHHLCSIVSWSFRGVCTILYPLSTDPCYNAHSGIPDWVWKFNRNLGISVNGSGCTSSTGEMTAASWTIFPSMNWVGIIRLHEQRTRTWKGASQHRQQIQEFWFGSIPVTKKNIMVVSTVIGTTQQYTSWNHYNHYIWLFLYYRSLWLYSHFAHVLPTGVTKTLTGAVFPWARRRGLAICLFHWMAKLWHLAGWYVCYSPCLTSIVFRQVYESHILQPFPPHQVDQKTKRRVATTRRRHASP